MVSAILAIACNNVIGKNNELPWPHIKEDMEWFQNHTVNNIVVMGSHTWSSLGVHKPLKKRRNIVISTQSPQNFPGADDVLMQNLPDSLLHLNTLYPNQEIFVIGGAKIYKLFAPLIDTWYVTRIDQKYEGDTFLDINSLIGRPIKSVTTYAALAASKWKKGLPKYWFEIYRKK